MAENVSSLEPNDFRITRIFSPQEQGDKDNRAVAARRASLDGMVQGVQNLPPLLQKEIGSPYFTDQFIYKDDGSMVRVDRKLLDQTLAFLRENPGEAGERLLKAIDAVTDESQLKAFKMIGAELLTMLYKDSGVQTPEAAWEEWGKKDSVLAPSPERISIRFAEMLMVAAEIKAVELRLADNILSEVQAKSMYNHFRNYSHNTDIAGELSTRLTKVLSEINERFGFASSEKFVKMHQKARKEREVARHAAMPRALPPDEHVAMEALKGARGDIVEIDSEPEASIHNDEGDSESVLVPSRGDQASVDTVAKSLAEEETQVDEQGIGEALATLFGSDFDTVKNVGITNRYGWYRALKHETARLAEVADVPEEWTQEWNLTICNEKYLDRTFWKELEALGIPKKFAERYLTEYLDEELKGGSEARAALVGYWHDTLQMVGLVGVSARATSRLVKKAPRLKRVADWFESAFLSPVEIKERYNGWRFAIARALWAQASRLEQQEVLVQVGTLTTPRESPRETIARLRYVALRLASNALKDTDLRSQ